MQLDKLGVWYFFDGQPATAAAEAAKRIEALGYSALWIPETVGRNPLVFASWLLANTDDLIVATGIANIYHREPGVMRPLRGGRPVAVLRVAPGTRPHR